MRDHISKLNKDKKYLIRRLNRTRVFLFIFLGCIATLAILMLSACQPVPKTGEATPQATVTQLPPTRVTPSLDISVDINETSTAVQATQRFQSLNATQTSEKASEEASENATATAIAPIIKELPKYSVKPSIGYVASIYEPITLTVDGFHASDSFYDSSAISITNFLMAADVTWDSEQGNAGCGFSFRSDGNEDTPDEYRVVFSRISGGPIYFYALANGKIANYRNFYAIPYDRSFDWKDGATNRLAIGIKDNTLYIFSNQIWVGMVDITDPPPEEPLLPEKPIKPIPPGEDLTGKDKREAEHAYKFEIEEYRKAYKKYTEEEAKVYADYNAIMTAYLSNDTVYDEGTVGLLAYSISGLVNCQFSNAFLWMLE